MWTRDALRLGEAQLRWQRHVVARRAIRASTSRPRSSSDGHEDREEAAREAAGAHARPVEMADILAVQEGALGIGAAPAHEPEQHVVVAVEDRKQRGGAHEGGSANRLARD